jgi:hypothetical protein
MGRVHSSAPIPVEQAQLIDPSAFRFDTSQAKALGDIGKVLMELGERKKKAQDSLAFASIQNAQRLATAKRKDFMVKSPDPATWQEGFSAINQEYSRTVNGLKYGSEEARKSAQVENQGYLALSKQQGGLLEATATIKQAAEITSATAITEPTEENMLAAENAQRDLLGNEELVKIAMTTIRTESEKDK